MHVQPRLSGLTLFIDADDTLWENNVYFDRAITQVAQSVARQGHSPARFRETLLAFERARVRTHGYGLANFRHCLELACEAQVPTPDLADTLRVVEAQVMLLARRGIEFLPGVTETLRQLAGRHRLILLTKGNHDDQLAKVARSGVHLLFHRVDVLREKDTAAYVDAARRHGIRAGTGWMVGNSPRSDIIPALAAGLSAVFIPHPDTWALELAELPDHTSERLLVLERFEELTEHF
ncbi:MAG: HAD hydrolase-like protein [Luteitalea sp.]|nr:HAD hydrolase-like protein [Luteitalea sp.]